MDFVKEINLCGGEVYIVGGAVRNILYNFVHKTNLAIKDKDLLVCRIGHEDLIKVLSKCGNVKLVGQSFGVYKYRDNLSDPSEPEIDIAVPRKKGATKIVVDYMGSVFSDIYYRDATINAMAIRIYDKTELKATKLSEFGLGVKNAEEIVGLSRILDSHNGYDDIKNKIWKASGNPYERFEEDPIRILRALRQCAELNMTLDTKTKDAIEEKRNLLIDVKNNFHVRITQELVRLLKAPQNLGMLRYFFLESGIPGILCLKKNPLHYFEKKDIDINQMTLRIKMALFVEAHTFKDVNKWCIQSELSASPDFPSTDVGFLECVSKYYEDINNMQRNDDYKLKMLLHKIEKSYQKKTHIYFPDLLKYYHIVNDDEKYYTMLSELYNNNKNTILTYNEVKLDGLTIMELWGKKGKQIAELKAYLYDQILLGKVKNEKEPLIKHVNESVLV